MPSHRFRNHLFYFSFYCNASTERFAAQYICDFRAQNCTSLGLFNVLPINFVTHLALKVSGTAFHSIAFCWFGPISEISWHALARLSSFWVSKISSANKSMPSEMIFNLRFCDLLGRPRQFWRKFTMSGWWSCSCSRRWDDSGSAVATVFVCRIYRQRHCTTRPYVIGCVTCTRPMVVGRGGQWPWYQR